MTLPGHTQFSQGLSVHVLRCAICSPVVAECSEHLASPSPSPSTPITSLLASDPDPGTLIGANAAAVYDATGHLVHTYHKSNLFPTDRTWARSRPGFTALDLPLPFGRTAVAICNDLNVGVRAGGGWASIEQGPYELAWWCRREGVRVLLLLNARLKPEDGGMEGVEGNWGDHDKVVSAARTERKRPTIVIKRWRKTERMRWNRIGRPAGMC